MSVRLTFIARDAAHAAKIAAAVAAIDAAGDILVPVGESYAGHSYATLRAARRTGKLDATITATGLRFSPEAFNAYERALCESVARRGKRTEAMTNSAVVDMNAVRIANLERAGMQRRTR